MYIWEPTDAEISNDLLPQPPHASAVGPALSVSLNCTVEAVRLTIVGSDR